PALAGHPGSHPRRPRAGRGATETADSGGGRIPTDRGRPIGGGGVNASSKPQRRRKSSLAGEHPAYPAPVPQQATQQQQPPSPEQGGGADEARARKYAR